MAAGAGRGSASAPGTVGRGSAGGATTAFRALVVVGVLVIVGGLVALEMAAQASAQASLRERFVARADTAASFLRSYVASTLSHEGALARLRLTGAVTSADLVQFDEDLSFGSSVVVDARGVVLASAPSDPRLLGARPTRGAGAIRRAGAGHPNVSNVLATRGRASVVAFSAPYPTASGERVVSSDLRVNGGTLSPYLDAASSLPESATYLLDAHGELIAASLRTPGARAPAAFGRLAVGSGATVAGRYLVLVAVPATPWRVAASVPVGVLYAPVRGEAEVVPWLLVLAAALLALVAAFYLTRLWGAQHRRALEADVDALTGLATRRVLYERAARSLSAARRNGFPVSLVLFDVDHFKSVNDEFGHQRGDDVLRGVALAIATALRTEDVGSRWGGEEFVVLLPFTGADEARRVAERVRGRVAQITRGRTGGGPVGLSAGVATYEPGTGVDELVRRADVALYRAKAQGRDRVVVYEPALEGVARL